jgi:hypothetical protein
MGYPDIYIEKLNEILKEIKWLIFLMKKVIRL